MKVLVIGGTRYFGRRILERLVERGDQVAVVSRGKARPPVLERVRHICVDRQDRAAFEAALRGETFDAVIDNLAFERADVESAARALGSGLRHYVLTSTAAVYHHTEQLAPLEESQADLRFIPPNYDPADFGQAYAVGKRQAELALWEMEAAPFRFTVIRPPVVVGPDDYTLRVWWFVQRILDGGPMVISEGGAGRMFQLVYSEDLASVYLATLGNAVAFGRAYNVAQPEVLTAETWIQALAGPIGREANWERIPEPLLEAAGLSAYRMPIAGRPLGHLLLDTFAARRDLAFTPTPFADWSATTARGPAEHPPSQDSPGYDLRRQEIAAARRFRRLRETCIQDNWQK